MIKEKSTSHRKSNNGQKCNEKKKGKQNTLSTILQQDDLKIMKEAWTKMLVLIGKTESNLAKGTCWINMCPLISITGAYIQSRISQWTYIRDSHCSVWWYGVYHPQHGPEKWKERVFSGDLKENDRQSC